MRVGKRGDGLDTDAIIVEKVRNGDIDSFEPLVAAYQNKIFAFIYRMVMSVEDARDLTQEAFLQAFRSLDTFRGNAKFSTWLYRIAANKTLDYLRKNQKAGKLEIFGAIGGDLSSAGSPDTNPENIILSEEKIRRLRRLISGLPDKYKITLVLFHYENLTYQQISDTLEIPVKTVATRLYRAKLILRAFLGGETDEMP